jgi:methylmalonyl-CoA carboxyltransferase large subunit
MAKVNPLIKSLQEQIAALEARVAELERPAKLAAVAAKSQSSAPAPKPAPPPPVQEEISEEIMLVIAAAVAAYFGERAHIRVVRLVPSHAWAQQGRVSIQASHRLA